MTPNREIYPDKRLQFTLDADRLLSVSSRHLQRELSRCRLRASVKVRIWTHLAGMWLPKPLPPFRQLIFRRVPFDSLSSMSGPRTMPHHSTVARFAHRIGAIRLVS